MLVLKKPMKISTERETEQPNWRKYPMERVIMNQEKHKKFVEKCKEVSLPKSRVINILIDKWLKGKVSLNK